MLQRFVYCLTLACTFYLCFVLSGNVANAQSDPLGRDLPGTWVGDGKIDAFRISTHRETPGIAFLWDAPSVVHVSGLVVSSLNGAPVPNASLTFNAIFQQVYVHETTIANDDGKFEIDLPLHPKIGAFLWTASAMSGTSIGRTKFVASANLNDVRIEVMPGRHLSIRATEEESGIPIKDFQVRFHETRLEKSKHGVCEFYETESSTSEWFTVIAEDRACHWFWVDLSADIRRDLNVKLVKGKSIRGVVYNTAGLGVPLCKISSMRGWNCRATTALNGEFTMYGIPVNEQLDLFATNYRATNDSWNASQSSFRLNSEYHSTSDSIVKFIVSPDQSRPENLPELKSSSSNPEVGSGCVRGTVRLPDGTFCKQFEVRVFGRADNSSTPTSFDFDKSGVLFGNENGEFAIRLPEKGDEFSLAISAKGYADSIIEKVKAVPGKDTLQNLNVVLQPAHELRFEIIDEDHEPVPGVRVRLVRSNNVDVTLANNREFEVPIIQTAISDAKGIALFERAPFQSGNAFVDGRSTAFRAIRFNGDLVSVMLEESPMVAIKLNSNQEWPAEVYVHFEVTNSLYRVRRSMEFAFTNNSQSMKIPLLPRSYTVWIGFVGHYPQISSTQKVVFSENSADQIVLDLRDEDWNTGEREINFDISFVNNDPSKKKP